MDQFNDCGYAEQTAAEGEGVNEDTSEQSYQEPNDGAGPQAESNRVTGDDSDVHKAESRDTNRSRKRQRRTAGESSDQGDYLAQVLEEIFPPDHELRSIVLPNRSNKQ